MAVSQENQNAADPTTVPELQVSVLNHLDSIERIAPSINSMTDVPFLQTHWMVPWIKSYVDDMSDLFFVTVFESKKLVGFAPLYRNHSLTRARQLKFIGSGEVSSDFMTFPTLINRQEEVVDAIAKKLLSSTREWDRIELEGVVKSDQTMANFVDALREAGCQSHCFKSPASRRMDLSESWEQLMERHPEKTEAEFAKIAHSVDGRMELHFATDVVSLHEGMDFLQKLHELRWQAEGKAGCFESEQFTKFLNLMAWEELQSEQLWLAWMTIDEEPVASNISIRVGDGLYTYQCGESPAHSDLQPGRFIFKPQFERAIDEDVKFVDFLRGEEPCMGKWDWELTENCRYEIACRNPRAIATQAVLQTARGIKNVFGKSNADFLGHV